MGPESAGRLLQAGFVRDRAWRGRELAFLNKSICIKLTDARVGKEETEMGASWAKMGSEFAAIWEGLEAALAKPVLQYLQDHMAEIKKIQDTEQRVGGSAASEAMPKPAPSGGMGRY